MNIKSIYIAAVAIVLGLSSCNKNETLNPDGTPTNAVRISASLGNSFVATKSSPVGDFSEQSKFNNDDKILVKNSKGNGAVYQLSGTTWMPVNNKYLLWTSNSESFSAYYPIDQNNEIINQVQIDQSTLEKIALSDLLYCKIDDAPKGEVLNFEMKRQTSRIIVKIESFNLEFPTGSIVSNVQILISPRTRVSVVPPYIPFKQGDGGINSTYTLLADAIMINSDILVTLKVGNKEMLTNILPRTEKGNSYTFNLCVGKEKLEIESVTVEDWTNKNVIIPGGQADELS